jgi:hypothetical protein
MRRREQGGSVMTALSPLRDLWVLFICGWALREMDPRHPDVAEVAQAHANAKHRIDGMRTSLRPRVAARILGNAFRRFARRAALAIWAWC